MIRTQRARAILCIAAGILAFWVFATIVLSGDPDNDWTWFENALGVLGIMLAVVGLGVVMFVVGKWVDRGEP